MKNNILRPILIMLLLVMLGCSQPIPVESSRSGIIQIPTLPEYSQEDIQNLAGYWDYESRTLNGNESVICSDIAITLDPNSEVIWGNRAMILEKMGKYGEALNCYYNVIRVNPNAHMLWTRLGINLQKQGFYEAALMSYDEALRQDPKDEIASVNRQNVNDYLLSIRI